MHNGFEVPRGRVRLQGIELTDCGERVAQRGLHMLDRRMSLVRIVSVLDERQCPLENWRNIENWCVGHIGLLERHTSSLGCSVRGMGSFYNF